MDNSNETMIENIATAVDVDADAVEYTEKYLSFMLDDELCAFNIMVIKEIIEYENVNKMPLVPSYIRGVINLRGAVVPVIDLAARLGKAEQPVSKRTCIIIVEVESDGEKVDVGAVIDSIYEVTGFAEQDVEPAPGFGSGVRTEFIEGMGRRSNDEFVMLLNAERVLSIDELSELIGKAVTSGSVRSVSSSAAVQGDGNDMAPPVSE